MYAHQTYFSVFNHQKYHCCSKRQQSETLRPIKIKESASISKKYYHDLKLWHAIKDLTMVSKDMDMKTRDAFVKSMSNAVATAVGITGNKKAVM